jgi:hypothetical protein
MTQELIEATKKAIGYSEKQNTCKDCKYSKELENPHLDRSWIWQCTVNSICSFEVHPNGRCTLYQYQYQE